MTGLGHEIWMWPGNEHPSACTVGTSSLGRMLALRRMDALYFRIEWALPHASHLLRAPYRQLIKSPAVIWEFNAGPEFGVVAGHSSQEMETEIDSLKRYGRRCDLAICVSAKLADYVRDELGIRRVLSVPNGSDPQLFSPDVAPVQDSQIDPRSFNVVWIGSADIRWHNFELLRAAAQRLWDAGEADRITFHIIGHGLSPTWDMPPNVRYHGPRSYAVMPQWLAAMDVGLCLYHPGAADFNSPLKLFDYMSSGLLVIGTRHPQLCSIFNELGQPDLAIRSDDAEGLASLLSGLAADRQRARAQGDKGRRLVVAKYNWQRAARDSAEAIQEILDAR
jgi:glycosyltransferase involved in cell wall biosynthesis